MMSMPVLKVDILRRVVDFALESCVDPKDEHISQLQRQECLANLIQVSKLFEAIYTPLLYTDCLVSNIEKFMTCSRGENKTRKLDSLCNLKTLRVYHSKIRGGATYFDLISNRAIWSSIGASKEMIPGISSEWVDIAAHEYHRYEVVGSRFQQKTKLQAGLFGSIDRVCKTTTGDQTWGHHHEHHIVDQYFHFPWLPTILLSLPSVQHYCQTSMLGPLAIENGQFKPTNPPKIVTYHYPRDEFWDSNKKPPIVFGAINRYMSPVSTFLANYMTGEFRMAGGIRLAFQPLLDMLGFESITFQNHEQMEQRHLEDDSEIGPTIDGTVLEVYNFLELGDSGSPKENLAKLQKVLDSVLGQWKGKVILKDKEDCPPCSACGYKYKE